MKGRVEGEGREWKEKRRGLTRRGKEGGKRERDREEWGE